MREAILVATGGAIGSLARWWLALAAGRTLGVAFPWGTILINVAGSAAIGIAAARLADSPGARLFVMTGLCGGFTTFSAFSLQTADLLRQGRVAAAMANVAASVILCVAATLGGYALASRP